MKKNLIFLVASLFMATAVAQDIYDINKVQVVKIQFENNNWHHILDSLKQAGKDDRLLAKVEVNGTVYDKVGVRYKGNSSFFNVQKSGSTKLPFNIKINWKNKKQTLPGGYKTLKLSNVFRDPSFLREVLSYEIARQYMPAPKANYAKVYVNDTYLGLYNNTESVDDKFLKANYGDKKGVFFKCDPNWNAKEFASCPKGDKSSLMYLGGDSLCYMGLYELKSDSGWANLVNLTNTIKENPPSLESSLDVDQVLWMLAFNSVLVNLDSYSGRLCHNYYLYQDRAGVFHPIVWDMNLSFGGFRYTGIGNALSNEAMQTLSPFEHYKQKNPNRPLISTLLANNLYRGMYVAHIRTILKDFFSEGQYKKRAEEIQQMIDEHVKGDENKLYPYDTFKANFNLTTKAGKSNIIGIVELMDKRKEYLNSHPLISKTPPTIETVEHIDFKTSMAVSAKIKDGEQAWLFFRYSKEEPFQRVEMFDDSGHNDEMEGDGIWGATIESNKGTEYYIVAQGNKTAVCSPEKASFEYYTVE